MGNRFDILYRFSTDNGATWTDLTPQVDSLQTSITQNLCLNTFLSAKDEATFVMPETPLFEADGVTPTPKKLLIDAIFGNDPILVHINERKPSKKVMWDDNNVLWKGRHVVWSWSTRRFTGYVDRSSISLRSYPLPPNLTVRLQDVSVLHLDDKVDRDVCLEDDPDGTRLRISTIVSALLGYAGYTNIGSLALEAGDDQIIEAFVIDKDKAKTYRNYIDTLLFEAGGYVLDFNEYGQANIVHLQWDGSVAADRILDNPMNNDGVTMRTAYLVNDGASVKWSTLAWAENERIWQSNISQKIEDGVMIGDIVHDQGYWPNNGDVSPVYFQYDAKLLDIPYLHKDTRWENEDLSIIMAKNTHFGVDTLKGTTPVPISDWSKHDPNTWPAGDTWHDKYGLNSNPQYWPTKMWIQLQNTSGEDYNVSLAYIYGDVLYRNRINTIKTAASKNPKEYVSEYIYDKDHAERFLQFYWHFLQTSRYQFNWSEPNVFDALNSVISVGIKGNGTTQKALVVGKTSKWLNAATEIVSFASVAIDAYVPEALIPTVIAPSSSQAPVPSTKNAITATFSTVPSFTLAEWETFSTSYQSWTITNDSAFTVGDIARINGVISDMDDTPVSLFMDVTAVDTTNHTISGSGIRIEYNYVNEVWDFDMEATSAVRNDRLVWDPLDSNSYTDIHLTSLKSGISKLEYWECTGTKSADDQIWLTQFVGPGTKATTGDTPVIRIYKQESLSEITVTMKSSDNVYSVTKKITIINETVYDYDFGLWEPNGGFELPDHFTVGGIDYDIINGDFFVAKTTFTTTGGQTYTEGIPYMYSSFSWNNPMMASVENSDRMLRALANILGSGTVQPSAGALYGWFANLVAMNAIIDNLTAKNLNVGTYGTGFSFRALTDDGNGNKIFDVTYNGTVLFKVDIATGKIYFGQGFWYNPTPGDMSIHSANDNVVIGADGYITINNGLYKSNLQCPSFRSLPKDPPSQPTYLSVSGNDTSQFTTMYNFNHSDLGVLIPCLHSASSSVKYLKITYEEDGYGMYPSYDFDFLNSSGNIVGSITGYLVASYCIGHSSTWENTSFTLTLGNPTDVAFQLLTMDGSAVSIGTLSSDTRKGELYYVLDSGGATGTVHIKL